MSFPLDLDSSQTLAREQTRDARAIDLCRIRLGLYWNGKDRGDVALETLGAHAQKRFPGVQVEMIASGIPGPPEKVAAAARFDAVVGSTGDCGSCTSWLAHDLAQVEKHGVPAVALVTKAYEELFRASATLFGVPQLPYVVVCDQTLATLEPDEARRRTAAVVDIVIERLAGAITRLAQDASS